MRDVSRITLKMVAAGLVLLSATTAHAQFQISIAPGSPGAPPAIVDNDANDTDKNLNAIGYNAQITLAGGVKFVVDIHAIQKIDAGKAMEVRIDELTIINSGMPVTSSIVVQSGAFVAIGPPFFGRVHLDGKYTSRGFINDATVSLSGSVSPGPLTVGTVTIPNVKNHQPPVAFGPTAPNQLKEPHSA